MGKKAEESERIARCQRAHAHLRARERLGVELTKEDFGRLKWEITNGRAKRIGRLQGSRVLYETTVAGQKVRVVWDRKTQQIVTFLTLDMEIREYADLAFRGD